MYFRKYKKWKSSFPFQKSFSFLLIKFNSYPNRKSFYILYLLDISILMKIKKKIGIWCIIKRFIQDISQAKICPTYYFIYNIHIYIISVWILTKSANFTEELNLGESLVGLAGASESRIYHKCNSICDLRLTIIMVGAGLGWCFPPITAEMTSIGTGKTMVLLFSAEMLFSVCR